MAGYLGIDIGTTFVRSVLVRGGAKRATVAAFASAARAEGVPLSETVRASVAELLRATKGGFDEIAAAVGGAQVTLHALSIPGTAKKQLAEVLRFELESHVPFDMEDAVFDWLIAKDGGEKGELELLSLTSRTDDVRYAITTVKEALDVEPSIVSAGALSLAPLAGAAFNVPPASVVAMLDVGTRTTDLVVVRGGAPVFSRTIGYGTEGMPANAAALVRDLKITLVAIAGQVGAPVEKLFLSGGGAAIEGARRFFEGELQLPVEEFALAADGSLQLTCEPPPYLPAFAKAIGLAYSHFSVRGFNLRRGPLAYEGGFRWLREQVPALAGVASVLAVSLIFADAARLWSLSSERHTVSSSLGIVTKEVFGEEANTASRASELLEKELGGLDEDPMPHADAFDVVMELSKVIPEAPVMVHDIEDLDVQKGHATVHAIVGTIADTDKIVDALKAERCISEPKIKSTSQVIGGDRQKYTLEFDLKCPEDMKAASKKKAETPGSSSAGTGGN